MTLVSIGDLAQSFLLKSQTARLKTEVGRLTQEFGAGRVSDVGATLTGDFSRLSSVSRARSVTEGYLSAARAAATQSAAMQSAFSAISDTVQSLVSPLLGASQLDSTDQIVLTGVDARGRLDTVLATMNISAGGRTLFAGQLVHSPAVAGAGTILTALQGALAGTATAQDAMTRISDWFDDPAGYRAMAYQGGVPLDPVAVSATDQVWLGVTAEDPAFRSVLKGLAAAALIGDSGSPLPSSQNKLLARLSADTLMAGQDALTNLAARLGISEGRIEAAQSRNAVDLLAHEMAQADLVRSDPERLAIELEAMQTSLESVFAITARLSRMSLTDFLR